MCPKKEKLQEIGGLAAILDSKKKTNSLIIGVSVGSEPFEGIGLSSLVNALNGLAEKVTHCTIAVCDTLQRHNYRLNGTISEEDAFPISERAGDEWIARNTKILENLKIPYSITRWNEWLNNPSYVDAFREISSLFDEDSEFKKAIESSINTFSSRFKKRHEELGFSADEIDRKILEQSCRAYLLEECAIIMKLWPINKDEHCEFLLYPGKMTKALAYTYDKFVVKKSLFKWNKFILKKATPLSENNSALFNLQEKIALTSLSNVQKEHFFLSVFAGCMSIMASRPDLSNGERLDMLFTYTKKTSFLLNSPPVSDAFQSTSQEGNFFKK